MGQVLVTGQTYYDMLLKYYGDVEKEVTVGHAITEFFGVQIALYRDVRERIRSGHEKRLQRRSEKSMKVVIDSDGNTKAVQEFDTDAYLPLSWFSPLFSGGGYSSEGIEFALSLSEEESLPLSVSQFGDHVRDDFVNGMDMAILKRLLQLEMIPRDLSHSVVVCHSHPGSWAPPNSTALCPPEKSLYTIGRTMFETDSIPTVWFDRLNSMDVIWVPTHFQLQVFLSAGFSKRKVEVVPQSVHTEWFDPARTKSAVLPIPAPLGAWNGGQAQKYK